MIDIDYFKNYNDTNGHLAGDQVLKTISMIIQHAVRGTDVVARYGGEEFCAILINTGKEGALAIAERVRRMAAEMPFPNENAQPNGDLTVSVGVATFSSKISTVTDLIREADNALTEPKEQGEIKWRLELKTLIVVAGLMIEKKGASSSASGRRIPLTEGSGNFREER